MPAEFILRADDHESLLALVRGTVAADGNVALLTALAIKINEQGARLDQTRTELSTQGINIMATQAQVTADLRAVQGLLDKIHGETSGLLERIEELNARLEESGDADPELVAIAADLRERAQRADDLVADAPAPSPEPAPEPTPVEPEPDDGSDTDSAAR